LSTAKISAPSRSYPYTWQDLRRQSPCSTVNTTLFHDLVFRIHNDNSSIILCNKSEYYSVGVLLLIWASTPNFCNGFWLTQTAKQGCMYGIIPYSRPFNPLTLQQPLTLQRLSSALSTRERSAPKQEYVPIMRPMNRNGHLISLDFGSHHSNTAIAPGAPKTIDSFEHHKEIRT
jgi:hypothetical protein